MIAISYGPNTRGYKPFGPTKVCLKIVKLYAYGLGNLGWRSCDNRGASSLKALRSARVRYYSASPAYFQLIRGPIYKALPSGVLMLLLVVQPFPRSPQLVQRVSLLRIYVVLRTATSASTRYVPIRAPHPSSAQFHST